MSARALILTYHAVEVGDGPLYVAPELLGAHLDAIVASGADVVTVSELASALRDQSVEAPAVAITFDDGAASVARVAAPLLAERSLRATVFCVAGHLGGRSDWPSARPGPTFELATAAELAELAASGWEIGAHGMTHAPLISDDAALLEREIVEARSVLEQTTHTKVLALALPYGARPSRLARAMIEETYESAVTTEAAAIPREIDPWALPRVDAYYVRDPGQLGLALEGRLAGYLRVRRLASRARRLTRSDYRAGHSNLSAKGHAT